MEQKIIELIQPIVIDKGYQIVDVTWEKMGHQKVLSIALQDEEGTLDLEQASELTQPISDALDNLTELDFEYLLDVHSPGAEQPLKTWEAIKASEGKYVHVQTNDHQEVEGTLKEVTQDTLLIHYFQKGRPKKLTLGALDIKNIRLAVKF